MEVILLFLHCFGCTRFESTIDNMHIYCNKKWVTRSHNESSSRRYLYKSYHKRQIVVMVAIPVAVKYPAISHQLIFLFSTRAPHRQQPSFHSRKICVVYIADDTPPPPPPPVHSRPTNHDQSPKTSRIMGK